MPVIRTLNRFTEFFVSYSIESLPDIRTFQAGYKSIPDIRILYAILDNVLITGIHCTSRYTDTEQCYRYKKPLSVFFFSKLLPSHPHKGKR